MTPDEIKAWQAKFEAKGWILFVAPGGILLLYAKNDPLKAKAKAVQPGQLQAELDRISGKGTTTGQPNIVWDERTKRYYLYKGVDAKGNEVWDDLSVSKAADFFTTVESMNKALAQYPKGAGYTGRQVGEGTWVIEPPSKQALDYFPNTAEGIAAANEALKSYPAGYRLLPVGQGAVQIFPPEEQKPPSRLIQGLPQATQAAAESLEDDYPSQIGNSDWFELVTRPKAASLKEAYEQAILGGDMNRANELKGYLDQFTEYEKYQIKRQQEQDAEARVAAAEARGEARVKEVTRQKEANRQYELQSWQTQMDAWERAMQLGLGQEKAAQKANYLGVLHALNPPQFGPEGIPKPDFTSAVGPRPVAPVQSPPYPAGFENFVAQNTPGAFGQPVPELTPEEKAAAIERYRRQQLSLTPQPPPFVPPGGPGSMTREFPLPFTDEQEAAAEAERRRRMGLGTREDQLLGIAEG